MRILILAALTAASAQAAFAQAPATPTIDVLAWMVRAAPADRFIERDVRGNDGYRVRFESGGVSYEASYHWDAPTQGLYVSAAGVRDGKPYSDVYRSGFAFEATQPVADSCVRDGDLLDFIIGDADKATIDSCKYEYTKAYRILVKLATFAFALPDAKRI